MTRGIVDLKVVTDRLEIVSSCLRELRALPSNSFSEFLSDPRNAAAAESFLRRALEALLDVARHLLAKGFGESTVEYRKTALRAVEMGLVRDGETGAKFPLLAGYRNRLTHFYADVTAEELFGIVTRDLADVERLAAELSAAAERLSISDRPAP
jgi:uncharacterized protein YutE (UPF0331/DUF86 family)